MSTSTSISIPYKSCNHQNLTLFDLSAFKLLETIFIDGANFKFVNTFVIDGLFKLRSINLDHRCFVNKVECVNDPNKSCHIRNCKELTSLTIGVHVFDEYGGGFELLNLPKLKTIFFGNSYDLDRTYNFCYSDFSLRSIE